MSKIIDHVAFLAEEIGPRPSGTEEEQQAALYIADRLQKDARVNVSIEDFGASINSNATTLICYGVTILSALLAIFLPVASLPAAIFSFASMAILFMETFFERPVISRFFVKGISQNVVGRYIPPMQDEQNTKRLRKVVIVANYDSAKEQPFVRESLLPIIRILQIVTVAVMVAIPVILLIKGLFMGAVKPGAGVSRFVSGLLVLGIVFLLLPVVRILVDYVTGYNDAANNNASGVAVMLEAARLVGNGLVQSDKESSHDGHSVEQLIEAGVVPDGANLIDARDISPEASLAAAKAAIAAMTGVASSQTFTEVLAAGAQEAQEQAEQKTAEEQVAKQVAEAEETTDIPEWFRVAQEKASKNATAPVLEPFRSRYADVPKPGEGVSEEADEATSTPEFSSDAVVAADVETSDNATTDVTFANDMDAVGDVDNASQDDMLDDGTKSPEAKRLDTDVQPQQSDDQVSDEGITDAGDIVDGPVYEEVTEEELQASAVEAQADMHAAQMSLFDMVGSQDNSESSTEQVEQEDDSNQMSADAFIFDTALSGETVSHDEVEPVNPLVRTNRLSDSDVLSYTSQAQAHAIAATQFIPTINVEAQAQNISETPDSKESSTIIDNDPFADVAPRYDDDNIQQESILSKTKNLFSKTMDKVRNFSFRKQEEYGDEWLSADESGSIKIGASETTGWAAYGEDVRGNEAPQSGTTGAIRRNDDEWLGGAFDNIRARIPEGFGQRVKESFDSLTSQGVTRGDGITDVAVDHGMEGNEQPTDSMAPIIISDKGISVADEEIVSNVSITERNAVEDITVEQSADEWVSAHKEESAIAVATQEQADGDAADLSEEDFALRDTKAEIEDIYTFMAGAINTEVWFVALGSQLAGGQGVRAFMAEHADDMRGAVIVNLESLGAGDLSFITAEGAVTQGRASARLRRFMRKVAQSVGIQLNETAIDWRESAASYAQKHNMQAVTFAGMDGLKPAGFGERDDVLDTISEEQLQISTKMLIEFLKNI